VKQVSIYKTFKMLRQSSFWSCALLSVFVLQLLLQFSHDAWHHHEEEQCLHEANEVIDTCHLRLHHKGLDSVHECTHKTHIDKKANDFCKLCDIFAHSPIVFLEYFSPFVSLSVNKPFAENIFAYQIAVSREAQALLRNKSPPSLL
jgi:hypothetical protein